MGSTHLSGDLKVAELPGHKELPESDENAMPNMQQPPQTEMLNQCLIPLLREIHPDGRFCVASDCFIYFKHVQPLLAGCRAPDWFYVPGVSPMLEGEIRRSYVLWKESVRPLVVIEYVSGDGSEEHDRTAHSGKFWIYEQAIGAAFYVIFDPQRSALEVYQLVAGCYQQMAPNAQGRYLIAPLRVELGVWEGTFRDLDGAWLRGWEPSTARLLPLVEERAEAAEAGLEETQTLLTEQINKTDTERKRADEQARLASEQARRADEQARRAEALAARLRELGINPDEVPVS
jgi:Uma2 family endonuclease